MKINGEFESMEEGFAFCRRCNRPVVIQFEGKTYRLFPSGVAHELQLVGGTNGGTKN